ncbi:MAG: hypothetical protein ACRD00_06040 [Thermoanaerobaculia bacterium]
MKLEGVGTRAQAITLVVLALALALFLARRSTGGGGEPRLPAAAASGAEAAFAEETGAGPAGRGGKRARVKEVSPEEVPAIRPQDVEARRASGVVPAGRDLFDFRAPTPVPPPTPRPVSTPMPVCGDPSYVGPCPPPPPPSATPTPSPPEITFRFIGMFGPKDNPIAVLVQGDQVVSARAGDVVFERFRVVRVNYESVDIGFVPRPWTWKETRRLGIAP